MRLRTRLGVWLLKPLLTEELAEAHRGHHAWARSDSPTERYWMGRYTGALRILQAGQKRGWIIDQALRD